MYDGAMNDAINKLPDNPAELKALIANLTVANSDLTVANTEYQKKIRRYEEEIKILNHRLFGRKSEKRTPEDILQGLLFDEAEIHADYDECCKNDESEIITKVKSHTRKKPGRKPLPEALPRVDIIHDIDESEKWCNCGRKLKLIGCEITEKIDLIPAIIQVLRHIRYKYACANCEGTEDDGPAVKTAPMPPQMVPRGIVSPGLLAWILTNKFCDALPFYRQEKLLSRIGVEISRATLCNWAIITQRTCTRLLELMWQDIKLSPLVGMDETRIQVMKEPNKKNTTLSYMWVFRGGVPDHSLVMFRYNQTRGSDFINSEFSDYRGIIQTDGYQGYNALGKKDSVIHAVCWAHVRRKFKDAEKGGGNKSVSHFFLDMIGRLYTIETEIRENKYLPDEILRIRQEKSKPILEKIEAGLRKHVNNVAPKSLTGKAIAYTISLWQQLCVYIENPVIFIDNNMVENAIRPFVVGRKNWLFSGSPRGAHASAGIYSIIETARANGLEPYWYLRYLFEKLPSCQNDDEIRPLMPNVLSSEILDKYRGGVN